MVFSKRNDIVQVVCDRCCSFVATMAMREYAEYYRHLADENLPVFCMECGCRLTDEIWGVGTSQRLEGEEVDAHAPGDLPPTPSNRGVSCVFSTEKLPIEPVSADFLPIAAELIRSAPRAHGMDWSNLTTLMDDLIKSTRQSLEVIGQSEASEITDIDVELLDDLTAAIRDVSQEAINRIEFAVLPSDDGGSTDDVQ